MDKKTLYRMLCLPHIRKTLIQKSKKGANSEMIKKELSTMKEDPEVAEYTVKFLENWKDLTKFDMAYEDLKTVPKEQRKVKAKELKLQFCEWLLESDGFSQGAAFVIGKKEQFKEAIKGSPGKIKKKIKGIFKKDGKEKK